MKVKEVLKEEQLNEFVWTPASTAGLVALFGPTAAFWIMIALAVGVVGAVAVVLGGVSPFEIIKTWKQNRADKKMAKNFSKEQLDKIISNVKAELSEGQKRYIKGIENKMVKALESGDTQSIITLNKQLTSALKKIDREAAFFKREADERRREKETDAAYDAKILKNRRKQEDDIEYDAKLIAAANKLVKK